MDATRLKVLQDLNHLQQKARSAQFHFEVEHGKSLEAYRNEISQGIPEAMAALRAHVSEISLQNQVCDQLIGQATEYVSWLQWSLWDLPYFAVVIKPSQAHFRRAVVACGLIYLSIRIFDDVIDRHFWYKGKHPSLLSATREVAVGSEGVEGLTVLAALLLCFEGLSKLANPDHPDLACMLRPVVVALHNTVVGAVMENSTPAHWNRAYYDRLVELKNVDYWRSLYTSLDPDHTSALYPFLERYYTLAQHLNDVQDFSEDLARGQPNLLALYLSRENNGSASYIPPIDAGPLSGGSRLPLGVEEQLASTFLELSAIADELPMPDQLVAYLKLGESLEAAHRYGLFGDASRHNGVTDSGARTVMRLHWYSHVGEVIEQAGAGPLVAVNCGVCGSTERNYLFHKQGFAFHRCNECAHIYVSPRISAELQIQISEIQDTADVTEDTYLSVQKLYASSLCHLLSLRAPGSRLLDIGFGSGYLAELAQAYGFEVFGIDSSPAKIDSLWPRFGRRLFHAVIGRDKIPWRGFDVVIMSHILEHLPDPRETILEVSSILNPGGLLYVAVPDMDSMPFHIFGKRWDVISPLVHFQYFNRKSLGQLLRSCSFSELEQVQHPQTPPELSSGWGRLLQELSGSESSELAVLARLELPH